jgi:hypothetical protein
VSSKDEELSLIQLRKNQNTNQGSKVNVSVFIGESKTLNPGPRKDVRLLVVVSPG